MLHIQRRLAARLPFYYGWIVLACTCCAGFARQGPAVATLTIFVVPMSVEFGWTASEMAGAVSLGGVLAALCSPLLGPVVDRRGARVMLCAAVLMTGIAALLLSLTSSLFMFYLLFCIARTNFAGPFDLGIYGAVNSWFVHLRPLANSIVTVALMVGLTAMPLIAHAAIEAGSWRTGWIAVGLTVLVTGFVPSFVLMARQPEDLGLVPDGRSPESWLAAGTRPHRDPEFSRAEAIRTPAFWILLAFIMFAYPVQAGVSLHQAPHLLERGLDATSTALVVSLFSFVSGVTGVIFGLLVRRVGVRLTLSLTGLLLAGGTVLMPGIETVTDAVVASILFGAGIGGLLTIPPIAWADYFGRRSFGAIRGVVLTVQVTAQAAGPLVSGALRDFTGSYTLSLWLFAAVSLLAAALVLAARPPVRTGPRPAPRR